MIAKDVCGESERRRRRRRKEEEGAVLREQSASIEEQRTRKDPRCNPSTAASNAFRENQKGERKEKMIGLLLCLCNQFMSMMN